MKENIPQIRLGVVAVSRNNFADELSIKSRGQVLAALEKSGIEAAQCETLVVTEEDAVKALKEAETLGCNVLAVILGN